MKEIDINTLLNLCSKLIGCLGKISLLDNLTSLEKKIFLEELSRLNEIESDQKLIKQYGLDLGKNERLLKSSNLHHGDCYRLITPHKKSRTYIYLDPTKEPEYDLYRNNTEPITGRCGWLGDDCDVILDIEKSKQFRLLFLI